MKTKIKFYKDNGFKAHEGLSPKQTLYAGPALMYPDELAKYGISVKKSNKAFYLSGITSDSIGELHCVIYTEETNKIHLTEVEKMSGVNRIAWGERLILELEKQGHEGAVSWLINYGHSERASELRANWEDSNNATLTFHLKEEAYFN